MANNPSFGALRKSFPWLVNPAAKSALNQVSTAVASNPTNPISAMTSAVQGALAQPATTSTTTTAPATTTAPKSTATTTAPKSTVSTPATPAGLTYADKALKAATKMTKVPTAADLDKGEVVVYTNAKGQTNYYTLDYTGKLVTSNTPAKATAALNTYYGDVENKQIQDFKDSQSREINELTQTLKKYGYSQAQIDSVVASETAKNTEELARLQKVFSGDGLQYATKDKDGNFIANVDKDGNPAPVPSYKRMFSTLDYNDPKMASIVKQNVDSANKFVTQFERQFNITGDLTKSGKTKLGMDETAIYNAYDKGYLKYDPAKNKYFLDNTVSVPDYSKVDQKFVTSFAKQAATNPALGAGTVGSNPRGVVNQARDSATTSDAQYITANLLANPEGITYTTAGVKANPRLNIAAQPGQTYTISADEIKKTWAYNPDDGLYYPPGTTFTQKTLQVAGDYGLLAGIGGKGYARELGDILSRGTVVGDKAYTVTKNGQTYITDANGNIIGGSKGGKPLVDTGETDWNGNKIYSQESQHNTKYNKVTVSSLYMQDKDTGDIIYLGSPGMGYLHIKKKSGGLFGGGFGGIVGNILGGLALSAVLGPAGFGLSSGLASVASSAVMSAVNGGDFGDILKSALTATVSAGLQDKFATGNLDPTTTSGAINSVANDLTSSLKNLIGDLNPSDSAAINSMAGNLVKNALASGGDITKAVEMTLGNAAANVVGQQIFQQTGDSNLANSAVNAINTGVSTGDVTSGLGAGIGTYTSGAVSNATGSPTAGALAGTAVGTAVTGGDIGSALTNAATNIAGSTIGSALGTSTAAPIGQAMPDPTSLTGYSVNGTPTTLAGVPVDSSGNPLPATTGSGGVGIPSSVVNAGTQIANAYLNQPQPPNVTPPTTTGSTLLPTTGTTAPGTQVTPSGLPRITPTKVDVATLTPYTGTLPAGLTSTISGGTGSGTSTPSTPTTGGLPTTTPPATTNVASLTPYTGALPTGVNPTTTTPTTTPTTTAQVDVSKLKPITDPSLLPPSLRPTTAPLSQPA